MTVLTMKVVVVLLGLFTTSLQSGRKDSLIAREGTGDTSDCRVPST